MRIAIVVPGGVGADGVHAVIPALLDLIERLAARHEVLVIATGQAGPAGGYGLRGARVMAVAERRGELLGRLRAARRVVGLLRATGPDVIHALWLGLGSTAAIVAGRSLDVPVVASVGGGELVALRRIGYGGARSWRGRTHAALAIRLAAAVTAGSRSALEPVIRRRRDARWLPLGAAPDATAAEHAATARVRPPSSSGATLRLVVAASVNRVKGPDVVLGAVARARAAGANATLEWLGEDTLAGSTTALARALGLGEAVQFRGFRSHREVLDAWRDADLALQGSYHESQGVAVLEAAMAGVATVGTAVGLVAELAATDPPAAVAVPVGDAAALGDAIAALAREPERRARLGAAAQAWAGAHDADWTAATFEALYADVIGSATAGRRR